MQSKVVVILKIGHEENSGKTSMDGSVLAVPMPTHKTNTATFASRSILIQEIMLILTEKNGSNARSAISGCTQIVKSRMVLKISGNN